MRFCTSCGHELGIGRFCTNCGHQIDRSAPLPPVPHSPGGPVGPGDPDPSATAERRAARRSAALEPTAPRTPPSAADTPPAPRFPLFADEVGGDDDSSPGSSTHADLPATGRPASPASPEDRDGSLLDRFDHTEVDVPTGGRRTPDPTSDDFPGDDDADHPRRWTWVLGALALLLVVVGLVVWLTGGGDDQDSATDPTSSSQGAGATSEDLTGDAEAVAPGNAAPATEIGGDKATFVAANMLDGDPATAWRIAGDATGRKIVFTLPQESTITQVGLVNGYAKVAQESGGRTFDWYHGNRRITKVAWVFDDGTVVDQTFDRGRAVQSTAVDDVATTTITLRILEVTKPGNGRASRDFTAISDVAFSGTTG